jgi:sulfotransferase family protein
MMSYVRLPGTETINLQEYLRKHMLSSDSRKKEKRKWFVDFAGGGESTVFLAGSGRSGTTWLSELINYRGDFRYIFEPFWKKKVPICTQFNKRQYLKGEGIYPEFFSSASRIVNGKFRNAWTDRGNRRRFYFKRLVKEIRANLFLYWLHNQFQEMPVIFLMRHPCAAVNSKLKMGWDWDVSELLKQKKLVDDFLYPFKDIINSADSAFENLILLWCIENYVPLKQFDEGELFVVFYEELVLYPEREINRIFNYLGLDVKPDVFDRVNNPSALSRKDSAIYTGKNIIESWKEDICGSLSSKAEDILKVFNLDMVYSMDPMPFPEGISNFVNKE